MIEIRYDFDLVEFDTPRYTKTVLKNMGAKFRMCIREWLKTILIETPSVTGSGFPSQTGTLLGSMQPLGRILRVAVPAPRITRDVSNWADAANRGPGAGAALVQFEILDKGPFYKFTWTTQVLHHFLNDTFRTRKISTTPWKAVDKANKVFEKCLQREMPKAFPPLDKFITFKEIKG